MDAVERNYYRSSSTGTEQYHRVGTLGLVGTDGIIEMAETLQCFWVLSVIDSYKATLQKIEDDICFVKVHLNEKGGCQVRFEDGNDNLHFLQEIEFTDLKNDLLLYVFPFHQEPGNYLVIMPEEY